MEPDANFAADLAAEEKSRLATKIDEAVKQHGGEELAYQHLRDRELELVEEQDRGKTENTEILPTLHVSDIPRQQPEHEVRDSTVDNGVKVQWRETPTNGLTYFRALSMFKDLPTELRVLVPLFVDSLQRIGTKTHSMAELEDLVKLSTGGISFSYFATPSPHDMLQTEEGFKIGGYAFDRNIPRLYELIQMHILETDFDSPQASKMIRQLLQAGASGAADGIAETGHRYALTSAAAGLSPSSLMKEQTGGLTQVKLITTLAAAKENADAMDELIKKLKTIQAIVVGNLQMGQMRIALTCGRDAASANESALQKFLQSTQAASLPRPTGITTSAAPLQQNPSASPPRNFYPLPFQVHYSALALPTSPFTSQASAPFSILSKLLTHKHLHHEIREKGGAYGGGAMSNGLSGTFAMYSYRDPNPANTIKIYEEAGRWAAEREWSDRELEEAKLSVFQGVDAPQSVNEEGMLRFVSGIDHEMDQRRREWLLDVDAKDVRRAAEQIVQDLPTKAKLVVLGPERDFLSQAHGWKVQDMGLTSAAQDTGAENVADATAAAAV